MISSLTSLRESFAAALTPPPELTISQWSDEFRVLPTVSSSEPGKWRTSRFPFVKEVMDELSPQSAVQEVVFIGGAQIAKTEIGINEICYTIGHNPSPILYVLPTIETAEKFSTQRLTPSIDACPSLANKIVDTKHKFRDADTNTKRMKTFGGGILLLAGANSAASLRMMPISVLILDEIDSYVRDLQGEGDPVEIAKRRTSNFPRRKIFYTSTPGIHETSRIEPLFEDGDQRYFNVPCPFCSACFVIFWNNIKWEHDKPETAYLECPECKAKIEERHKTFMLDHGFWKATKPGRKIASFHLSSLYSPLGFYSWEQAATLFLKARRNFDKDLLKVFVNTVLGETYHMEGKSVEPSGLEARKEHYRTDVPLGALVLTAGVDVQEDRVEVEVVGWGKNNESWSIDYAAFVGDTEGTFVWQQLDGYLRKLWTHESGTQMNLATVCIDSGHRAKVVYQFCKAREGRRIFPIKGREGWGQGYMRKPVARNDEGVLLFIAYVDELKSRIYSDLRVDEKGPAFCHFPEKPIYNRHYFSMLTAETMISKKVEGRTKLKWHIRKGVRNEALDARCYAMVALEILRPNFEILQKPLVFRDKLAAGARKGKRVLSQGVA